MKFFFDNGVSPHLAAAFRALLLPDGHTVEHITDKFSDDTEDVDWIGQLGQEGGWVVISRDLRIVKNAHERHALAEAGLIVFVLAAGWRDQKRWPITWGLMRWWERLMKIADRAPAGAVYQLPFRYSQKPDSIKKLL